MSFGVAVTHNHIHVCADSFCAERCFRERSSHREEIDDTVVLCAKDGGHLLVRHIHAVDGYVCHLAIGQAGYQFVHLHGSHTGGTLHDVAETEVFDTLGGLGAVGNTDYLTCYTYALLGFVAAKHTALAAGTEDNNGLTVLAEFGGLCRCTGYVQCRQSQFLRHIIGYLGIDAALEQDGFTLDIYLVHIGTDGNNLVYAKRGEREGNERSDAVAFFQVDFAFQCIADFLYFT